LDNTYDLKLEIINYLEDLGVFKVGFASADKGWDTALQGCRPKDIMPNCNSVVVIATRTGINWYTSVKFEGKSIDVDGETYRICFLFTELVTLKLARFLEKRGYQVVVPSEWGSEEKWIDRDKEIYKFSFKLAAFEAGIGVFGRNGVIITPEYGPGIRLGVLLTDAELPPTGKLEEFQPCKSCYVCAKLCPVKAIDPSKKPPTGFLRELCINFNYYLRRKTRNRIRYCGICFENCPRLDREGFQILRHGSLASLNEEGKRLISEHFRCSESQK